MYTLDPSLPDHCEPSGPFLAFLSSHLGTCIPTPLALLSTLLGFLSILSWLFAQLPQIVKNYALQSTSGLSFFFLVEWCLGDGTNLVGALFTRQAVWQVVVAAYYVCVDIVLVAQYAWYSYYKPRRQLRLTQAHEGSEGSDDFRWNEDDDVIEGVSFDGSSGSNGSFSQKPNGRDKSRKDESSRTGLSGHSESREERRGGPAHRQAAANPIAFSRPLTRTLLLSSLWCATASARPVSLLATATHLSTRESGWTIDTETIGRFLSWSSTFLYLGSRLPQLYKNHVRRSTSGLSAKLFIAAFFGNLFYSCSLLTNPCAWADLEPYGGGGWVGRDGSARLDWIARAAPFFLGAAGVLALDAAVGLQFLAFSGQEECPDEVPVAVDERGHWKSVTGWMRGWVPSVKARDVRPGAMGERERLIVAVNGNQQGSPSYGAA